MIDSTNRGTDDTFDRRLEHLRGELAARLVGGQLPAHAQLLLGAVDHYLSVLSDPESPVAELSVSSLHPLFDLMSDGCILTDDHGRILEINDAGLRMLGLGRGEASRARLPSFIAPPVGEQLRGFLAALDAADGDARGRWEVEIRPRGGGTTIAAILDGVQLPSDADQPRWVGWFLCDASRQKAAEAALYDSNTKLDALFRAAPVAINAITADGLVSMWNPASERTFGWRPDEVLGRPPMHVSDEQGAQFRLLFQRVLEGEVIRNVEVTRQRKNGSPVELSLSAAPLRDMKGKIIGAISVAIDVTERKQAERDLAEARYRLAESREAEALRVARDLHDGAVQELIGMRYYLEEARRLSLEEPDERDALAIRLLNLDHRIVQVVDQLRGIVSDLRPVALEEYGLSAALERYVDQLRRELKGGPPEVALDLCPDAFRLPPQVALHLFRVAQEATRNAIRHARANRIEILFRCGEDEIRLEIHDDGKGFEPSESAAKLVRGGHFGLVGMRERVEGIGGLLEVETCPCHGTHLTARVPIGVMAVRETVAVTRRERRSHPR